MGEEEEEEEADKCGETVSIQRREAIPVVFLDEKRVLRRKDTDKLTLIHYLLPSMQSDQTNSHVSFVHTTRLGNGRNKRKH
jgi:hypothetical protein